MSKSLWNWLVAPLGSRIFALPKAASLAIWLRNLHQETCLPKLILRWKLNCSVWMSCWEHTIVQNEISHREQTDPEREHYHFWNFLEKLLRKGFDRWGLQFHQRLTAAKANNPKLRIVHPHSVNQQHENDIQKAVCTYDVQIDDEMCLNGEVLVILSMRW